MPSRWTTRPRTARRRRGSDYTATSGTLTFTAGETAKTVSGAAARRRRRRGQGDDASEALEPAGGVSQERPQAGEGRHPQRRPAPAGVPRVLRTPGGVGRDCGGDRAVRDAARRGLALDVRGAAARLRATAPRSRQTVTGLARAFGAEEATPGDDPWNDPTSAPGRAMSGRELLTGTSFRAVLDQGTGAQLTSWGQGASVSHFSGAVSGVSLERRGRDRCARHGLRAGPVARRVRAHAQPRRGHCAR